MNTCYFMRRVSRRGENYLPDGPCHDCQPKIKQAPHSIHAIKSSERPEPRQCHRQWSVALGTSRWDGIPASPVSASDHIQLEPEVLASHARKTTFNRQLDHCLWSLGGWLWWKPKRRKSSPLSLSLSAFLSILNSLSSAMEICVHCFEQKGWTEAEKLDCLNYQFDRIKIEKLPQYAATGSTKFLVTLCLWFQALSMSFFATHLGFLGPTWIRFSVLLTCGGSVCCKRFTCLDV